MNAGMILDVLLAGFIAWLAFKSLTVPDFFRAIIFFIAFGLGMALAWARLVAPDVAIAEAAIGAGLLGVLLIKSSHALPEKASPKVSLSRRWLIGFILFGALGGGIHFSSLVLNAPAAEGLGALATKHLESSGVEHPVTAVLLNYRAYDTWLEIAVLMLALWVILAIRGPSAPAESTPVTKPGIQFRTALSRGLVPIIILVSGYLLWAGKFAPGGAFQAGVVLAAGMILASLGGILPPTRWDGRLGLILGLAGFMAFLLVAIFTSLTRFTMLNYPPTQAGSWILFLEVVGTLSIAFLLFAFYLYVVAPPSSGQTRTDDSATQSSPP